MRDFHVQSNAYLISYNNNPSDNTTTGSGIPPHAIGGQPVPLDLSDTQSPCHQQMIHHKFKDTTNGNHTSSIGSFLAIFQSIYRHKLHTSPLHPCLCHPQSQWPLQVSGLPKNRCMQNPVDWDQVLLWFHGKMQLDCLLDQKWTLLFWGSVLSPDNINMMRYMQHSIRAHQIIIILQLITFTEGKWVHLPLTCCHLCYVIATNQ